MFLFCVASVIIALRPLPLLLIGGQWPLLSIFLVTVNSVSILVAVTLFIPLCQFRLHVALVYGEHLLAGLTIDTAVAYISCKRIGGSVDFRNETRTTHLGSLQSI